MRKLTRLAVPALVYLCFAFSTAPVKKTIVIDAGHGGDDHGASHGHLSEKALVQSIATRIKNLDLTQEIDIVLLREEDVNMSLNERVEKINQLNPDLLISLHVNYSQNKTENGISAYVSKKSAHYSASLEKAEILVSELTKGKLAKKEVKDVSLHVLNNVQCPAMMLELGYLTNDRDRAYIASADGQNDIAVMIMNTLKK